MKTDERGHEVPERIFQEQMGHVYSLAIRVEESSKILREDRDGDCWRIFEDYADGGFDVISQWQRDHAGDIDMVDTLLMYISEKAAEIAPDEEGVLPPPDVNF